MEFVPVRCCKERRRRGFWWGERFYSNETFNDRCHCEQRHMHFEFPLMCSPMLSRVWGMACYTEWGNECAVGRNGGPLHGLWCVTEAKNDQQKKKITLCENTIAKRSSAENMYSYSQGKWNRYKIIWQTSFLTFNSILTVYYCAQNAILFKSGSPDWICES